jgi:ABC-type sugar transport system substrate-binding protein
MENMKRTLVSLAVLGLMVGAAQAQEKKTMAVSVPTADHG